MKIFAISDLHLSGLTNKPMDIFGSSWEGHFEKIKLDWNNRVTDDDLVLIAGDISWGTTLEEGVYDLNSLKELKGTKIFIRGNHDYWWNGISKLRHSAPDNKFIFLQNDCIKINNIIVCGSRGWSCPGSADYTEHDQKLYQREAERFKLCFKEVEKVREEGDTVIAMIHYPPYSPKVQDTLFTKLFEENRVDYVVFGHIHGEMYFPYHMKIGGVNYHLTSCDKVAFTLQQIL